MFMQSFQGAATAVADAEFVSSTVDICVSREKVGDAAAREALLDRAFGPGRGHKTSARMRAGYLPTDGLSLVARDSFDGRLLGTVRLWTVALGDGRNESTLMLGPLGVEPTAQGLGIGGKLMRFAIAEAAFQGYGAIILVGDLSYYERFGFSADLTTKLRLPGPVEQRRLLGLEVRRGGLRGACGLVQMTGAMRPVNTNDAPLLDVAV